MEELQIAAIIVSYNSATALPECLASLHDCLGPAQVIVVDNASSDASVAIARELDAEVIASDSNLGFGAACNLGALSAEHEILLFVNPDVRVVSVDVARLRELIGRRPFGLLAPRALLVGEGQEPNLRRVPSWPYSVAREAFGPVLPRELSGRRGAVHGLRRRRRWLNGALLLAARSEFLDLGGFDERLFMYYEDQELSRRYARRRLPVWVTDAITARHAVGGSSGAHGDLRPIPSAASAMSSIELVGIVHGPRRARCAWSLYRGLRWCATAVVRLTARGPLSSRSEQKLLELSSTRSAMGILLSESDFHYRLVKEFTRGGDP
jgi:N-acetylglucosaminyl-diphospho-decaprenol L-rhamnosyltransferase